MKFLELSNLRKIDPELKSQIDAISEPMAEEREERVSAEVEKAESETTRVADQMTSHHR